MYFSNIIESVDTHTAGNPTRNLIAGVPTIPGKTMQEKFTYAKEKLDWVRQVVMHEPRGHSNMSGAIWTEPCNPEAQMGILFIDAAEHMTMCGHSTIGCVTAMLETGRIPITGEVTNVNIDTPAGLVRTRAFIENGRVKSVAFRNVPSFHYASGTVDLPEYGRVPYDVAFGGNTYALTESKYFHLVLRSGHLAEIQHAAQVFGYAVRKAVNFVHPTDPFLKGISHVMFYTKETDDPKANFRNTVIFLPNSVDRSPCGTGTSARVASLFAQGKLGLNEPFLHESVIGTEFKARIVEPATVGPCKGGIPEVEGSAYITGMHKFVVDPHDPLRLGFTMD